MKQNDPLSILCFFSSRLVFWLNSTLTPHFGRKYFNPGFFSVLNSEPSVSEIEGTGRRWYFTDKGPRDTHDLLLFEPNVFKGFPRFSSKFSFSILAGLEVLLFCNIFPLFSFFLLRRPKSFLLR